jgi:hypothetical protein
MGDSDMDWSPLGIHAAPIGESGLTPSCWRDTPHPHNRQGLPMTTKEKQTAKGRDI